jgi:DNA-binding CsgD family transcriptional regulator/DNA-binding Lrp family transcriptional regulator
MSADAISEPPSGARLGALGVPPVQEQVYLFLVREGRGRTAKEVADALRLSAHAVRDALRALENDGLITRSLTHPSGYAAGPPELTLDALANRRTEELAQIRQYAKELQSEFREAEQRGSAAGLVEVVAGREQVMRYYLTLLRTAVSRIDAFTKGPYVGAGENDQVLMLEQDRIGRGLRARSVYESEGIDDALSPVLAERSARIGEEVRLVPDLPMKLAIFDRKIGFAPLSGGDPDRGALVLRPSPLLNALMALFDMVWARAVPLRVDQVRQREDIDRRTQQVLLLMSAGMKDESIARTLGMSRRTVQKHVTTVMAALGARTRFQAALLASERGWIGSPADAQGPRRSATPGPVPAAR